VAGDHTRVIQVATPTVGGLMKFAVKTATCLGCRTPLSKHGIQKSLLAYRKLHIDLVVFTYASGSNRISGLSSLSTKNERIISKTSMLLRDLFFTYY